MTLLLDVVLNTEFYHLKKKFKINAKIFCKKKKMVYIATSFLLIVGKT